MELIQPAIGLLFWMMVSFLVVLFILKKFAWKPILGALKERETSIENALDEAEKARTEMASLQASNEKLLQEARIERDAMLKDARDMKDKIVAEAKNKAKDEADRLIVAARETIKNEKMAAITELKNQVATLSIDIAEKILRNELTQEEKQKNLNSTLLDEVNLN
ncbi:MAG: F0F1 ATP synthase subunit B [Flavobacteriales bacterium]|nr:F0F1 ATP synthase subunit B [Flavobacteriales bacterium]